MKDGQRGTFRQARDKQRELMQAYNRVQRWGSRPQLPGDKTIITDDIRRKAEQLAAAEQSLPVWQRQGYLRILANLVDGSIV